MAGDISDEEAAWRDLVAHYRSTVAADGAAPWPVREDLPGGQQPSTAGPDAGEQTDPGLTQVPPLAWPDPVPGVIPAPPQVRIIRPATPTPPTSPTSPTPPPAGEDDHYVPPPPPPLPRLDPVSKGAWVALFGGPGYLLIAVMLGWVVPGWAAFAAVAAFVGGFATLVVRMGERPPRDSGPDDGAVV